MDSGAILKRRRRRQSKLVLEVGSSSHKKVTFKEGEVTNKKEMIDDLRKEFKVELDKLREEWIGMTEKVKDLEGRIADYEKEIADLREELRKEREESGSLEVRSNNNVVTSRRSYYGEGSSRHSVRGENDRSSDHLSVREVGSVRIL